MLCLPLTPTLTGRSYSCALPVRETKKLQTLTPGFLRGPQRTAPMVITTLLVGCEPSEPSSPKGFYGGEKQEGWGSAKHRGGKHSLPIITLPRLLCQILLIIPCFHEPATTEPFEHRSLLSLAHRNDDLIFVDVLPGNVLYHHDSECQCSFSQCLTLSLQSLLLHWG